jgi:hypothetical protein
VLSFPEPGQRFERRQRKTVKSHILTGSPIKNCIQQETLAGLKIMEIKKRQKNATKQKISSNEYNEEISIRD